MKLIPCIEAEDLPDDVTEELEGVGIYTHGRSHVIYINWTIEVDNQHLTSFVKWLFETYGDEIKTYNYITLAGT